MDLDLDLSDFSPALREAMELRMKELGYDSLETYLGALIQDDMAGHNDPELLRQLTDVPEGFDEALLADLKQRLKEEPDE